MTKAKKYFLYEVYINGKKDRTYRDKLTADREASGAMMGTNDKVEVRAVKRLPGPSFDDDGYTIMIDARGYGHYPQSRKSK